MKKYTDLDENNVLIELVPKKDVVELVEELDKILAYAIRNLEMWNMDVLPQHRGRELIQQYRDKLEVTSLPICQDCKKAKEDVRDTTCPFAHEIHDSIVNITVCGDCYYERCMDI